MKFVIDQYSTDLISQPEYLARALQESGEHQVLLNDFSQTIFEMLDRFDPDVYITHCQVLSRDTVCYIQDSDKDIPLFICNDGSKYGSSKNTFQALKEMNINYRVFQNKTTNENTLYSPPNTIPLLPAVEMGLLLEKTKWDNKFDTLVIADGKEELDNLNIDIKGKHYHIFPIGGTGDIKVPAGFSYANLVQNYDEVLFTNIDDGLNELFFQSIVYCDRVYFYSENKTKQIDETIKRIFKIEESLSYNNENKIQDFSKLKQNTKEKHTSVNRAKTILSQLPQKIKC